MSWAPERLYDELGRGAEIIRALLAGITQAEAVAKPDPKGWSITDTADELARVVHDSRAALFVAVTGRDIVLLPRGQRA